MHVVYCVKFTIQDIFITKNTIKYYILNVQRT
jgi:hypothetical protein